MFLNRVNILRIFGKFYRYCIQIHVFFPPSTALKFINALALTKKNRKQIWHTRIINNVCPMPPTPCSYVYQLHVLASLFGNLYIYSLRSHYLSYFHQPNFTMNQYVCNDMEKSKSHCV